MPFMTDGRLAKSHTKAEIIAVREYGIAMGYEDCNDFDCEHALCIVHHLPELQISNLHAPMQNSYVLFNITSVFSRRLREVNYDNGVV